MKINNVIIVKGGKSEDIKIALQQWIKHNSDKFVDHISFDIFENGVNNYLIKADDKLDNEHFFHLVNYIKYPNISNYKIDIEGFTITNEYDFLIKGPILVYIPDTDTDYDNVFCVTQENEVYKFDFGGNISKTSLYREYIEPEIDLANLPKIDSISIRKKRTSKLAKEKLELKKINK